MSQPIPAMPTFAAQYASLVKAAFAEQVNREAAAGQDLVARAREYAERGKPEFVLAYLVVAELPDAEKRTLLADTFERRAETSERYAAAMDAEHHRPFPLIGIEARKDRSMARQVRQGKMIKPYARASKPLAMQ